MLIYRDLCLQPDSSFCYCYYNKMLLQGTANLYNTMLTLVVLSNIIVILYSCRCIRKDILLDTLARSEPSSGDVVRQHLI